MNKATYCLLQALCKRPWRVETPTPTPIPGSEKPYVLEKIKIYFRFSHKTQDNPTQIG